MGVARKDFARWKKSSVVACFEQQRQTPAGNNVNIFFSNLHVIVRQQYCTNKTHTFNMFNNILNHYGLPL
jgi:hypothetical protein